MHVKWVVPIVAAEQLSAADGAVAVACADGMLLLDVVSGQLIRCAYCRPESVGCVACGEVLPNMLSRVRVGCIL